MGHSDNIFLRTWHLSSFYAVSILPFLILTGHLVNMLKDVSQPYAVFPLYSRIAYWYVKLFRTTNKNAFIFSLDGYNANFLYLDLYSNHQALQGVYKECFIKSLKQNLFFILKQLIIHLQTTLQVSISYHSRYYDALFLLSLAAGSVFIKIHQSMHNGVGREAAIEVSLIFLHIIVLCDCR